MAPAADFEIQVGDIPTGQLRQIEQAVGQIMKQGQDKTLRCEDDQLHEFLAGYLFLALLALAAAGNILSLMICNSDQIRSYLAVRVLSIKLGFNTLCMLTLLPTTLKILNLWEFDSSLEQLYWEHSSLLNFFGSVFEICGMWTTVLMVYKCYTQIFRPLQPDSFPNQGQVIIFMMLVFIFSVIISLSHIWPEIDGVFFEAANSILALGVPLLILVYLTASIATKLLYNDQFARHFSAEKACVTRITIATTVLQFLASLYDFLEFDTSARANCTLVSLFYFCFICNLALPFWIFVGISARFRTIVKDKIDPCIPSLPTLAPRRREFERSRSRMIFSEASTDDPSCMTIMTVDQSWHSDQAHA